MANKKQLAILKQGVEVWNDWKQENSNAKINLRKAHLVEANLVGADLSFADLREANLRKADLSKVNLRKADLRGADLRGALFDGSNLTEADFKEADVEKASFARADLKRAILSGVSLRWAKFHKADLRGARLVASNLCAANLSGADLRGAALHQADFTAARLRDANLCETYLPGSNLHGAILSGANLNKASLRGADLTEADLSGADMTGADLSQAILVRTKVHQTKISASAVYGVNVWDLEGEFEAQRDLIITPESTSVITVDNIKVAQFIYLILSNEQIRDVINTLTSKSVLILGRFAIPERKAILEALRDKLREYDLLPIVFDFDRPIDKDLTETIKTLAGLAYFVIADITNPRSAPLELQATVPDYQIPFVPIIQECEKPFAMMADLHKKYNWVLPTRTYDSVETLLKALKPRIIDPAIKMHHQLAILKAQKQEVESLKDFLEEESQEQEPEALTIP